MIKKSWTGVGQKVLVRNSLWLATDCKSFEYEGMGAVGLEPTETEVEGFTVPCNCRYATPPNTVNEIADSMN